MEKKITFKDIGENKREVLELDVDPSQKNYIETVAQCLEEAQEKSYGISWHPIAIYDENVLIGFSMYGKAVRGRVWLDRFMIDRKYQGRGYGKAAFAALLEKIREEYKTARIYLSVNENNKVAIGLYRQFGFEFIEELDGKDPVMRVIYPL